MAGKQSWLDARLDALFAYRLPQQLSVLLYKNGERLALGAPRCERPAGHAAPNAAQPLLRCWPQQGGICAPWRSELPRRGRAEACSRV